MRRIVVWFSCGTASAVALKLAKKKYGEVNAVYCDTGSEHPSNKQFLKDVTEWAGVRIETIKNPKYCNIIDVFLTERFISGIMGAPCTKLLKKWVRIKYQKPTDIQILGYTLDEKHRANRFDERYPEICTEWNLIENYLTKDDCNGVIWKAGIKIPVMYDLGYGHNNCIGCVKGKKGYWNKIRIDFPKQFERMAEVERILKYTILRKNDGTPLPLDELKPGEGNFKKEPAISCGFDCELMMQNL